MRFLRSLLCFFCSHLELTKLRILPVVALVGSFALICATPTFGQVQRDSAAVMAIANAITKMGGLPPQDSTATASATITNPGATVQTTAQFSTHALDQTAEQFSLPAGAVNIVYSRGDSNDKSPRAKPGQDPFSYELSLTAQSPFFPLPWLAARYANADVAIENIGMEKQAGVSAIHLRLTNTFASTPLLANYASMTVCDVWLNATTNLPLRIEFERKDAGGPSPGVRVAYEFSDYRNVQGFLYPFHIRKYVNGPIWADITVQTVSFNTGVPTSTFAIN